MSFKCDYSASPYFKYIDRVIFASCSAQVLCNVVMTLVFVHCMKQKLLCRYHYPTILLMHYFKWRSMKSNFYNSLVTIILVS